ncbi:MAG: hypothetical protein J6S85_15155 [Methanobrevibacter sp.]|nr:hypothetical protein [Methanobrevibacter sp.]
MGISTIETIQADLITFADDLISLYDGDVYTTMDILRALLAVRKLVKENRLKEAEDKIGDMISNDVFIRTLSYSMAKRLAGISGTIAACAKYSQAA